MLLLIWVFCLGLYYRDKRARKILIMKYIVGMYVGVWRALALALTLRLTVRLRES